jgi:hypothetical protein
MSRRERHSGEGTGVERREELKLCECGRRLVDSGAGGGGGGSSKKRCLEGFAMTCGQCLLGACPDVQWGGALRMGGARPKPVAVTSNSSLSLAITAAAVCSCDNELGGAPPAPTSKSTSRDRGS